MNAHGGRGDCHGPGAHHRDKVRDVRKRRGLSQRELAGCQARHCPWSASWNKVSGRTYACRPRGAGHRITRAHHNSRCPAPPTQTKPSQPLPQTGNQCAAPWPADEAGARPRRTAHPRWCFRDAMRSLGPTLADHRYTAAKNVLPALLADADALDPDPAGRKIQSEILNTTGYLLTQTRQFDIAELTLTRAIDAASDRFDAAAAADTKLWLYLRQGRLAEAREFAAHWADASEPRFSRATVAGADHLGPVPPQHRPTPPSATPAPEKQKTP